MRSEKHKEQIKEWYDKHPDYKEEWRKKNKDKNRKHQFKFKFKATNEQYDHYLSVTHCECCGVEFDKDNKKCQDHCHDTGRLRGVICHSCNSIEGFCKDNPDRLTKVWEYIQRQRNSKI